MASGKGLVLGLDSSNSPLLVVLADGDKQYSVRRSGVKQERLLFPAINAVLKKADATLQDIATVFFIRGPGRFTGIRISITFASMMSFLNRSKVMSTTVFQVIRYQTTHSLKFKHWQKQNPKGHLAVVLHAFREEYFLQLYDGANQAPMWLSREKLLEVLAQYPAPLFIAGTDKDAQPLDVLLGGGYTLADFKHCVIHPKTLIALSADETYRINALEPLYLKPARFELSK